MSIRFDPETCVLFSRGIRRFLVGGLFFFLGLSLARATTASPVTTFSGIPSNVTYQSLAPGYTTPATLTQTDIVGSGWDVVAQSNDNAAFFQLRGINSVGFGVGDNTSIRIQSGGDITFFDLRANNSSFTFDFTSFDLRAGSTGDYKIEALDSTYSVIAGSAVTITLAAGNVFQTSGSFASNSKYNDIYGVRVTRLTVINNWSPYVDNITVSDIKVSVTPPTVTTATQSSVAATSATLGGNVTSDGGASVTERGIVWATTGNPTTSNTKVANGSGTGAFSATVTGLPSSSTIHVRAYALNSAGTSYGSDVSFSTPSSDTTKPTVVSIVRQNPSAQPLTTAATTVIFRVTYSEAVTGVVAANFQLEAINGGTATGTVGTPSPVSASVYDIPVTLTGGSGEFRLKVVN